jgi:hypothetical protein
LEAGATVTASGFKSSLQDQERVLGTDSAGNFVELTTPVATLGYIDNVTSDIQTQLDGKLSSATNANQFGASTTLTIKDTPLITNAVFYGTSVSATGRVGINITNAAAMLHIVPYATNTTGILVKALTNQTADLFRTENSSGTKTFTIRKDGAVEVGDSVIWYVNDYASIRWGQSAQNFAGAIGITPINNAGAAGIRLELESTSVLQFGADAATATAQTIKAHDGSGTDKAGASLTINGGQSTGTGIGGALIKNTSLTGASSTNTANSYSVREYIYAGETTLTEGAATGFVTIALPASKYAGVHVFLTTHADDATDFQATTDMFSVSAVAKGTNISSNVATPTQSTIGSTGTLTTAITVTSTTNNTFTLNCNATSSLTQTTLKAKWQIRINSDAAATVTPL